MQQSGNMIEARKLRFHKKDPNVRSKQVSALRRLEMKEKREYLIKVGKYVEPEKKSYRR